MPRIDINAHTVASSKPENLWWLDTLTQLSNIAQISWAHIMIFGHGRMYIHSTDTHNPKNDLLPLVLFYYLAETVQRPVWFPSLDNYTNSWWGASFTFFFLLAFPLTWGGWGMCCLRTLYFKCFNLKRFKCTQNSNFVSFESHFSCKRLTALCHHHRYTVRGIFCPVSFDSGPL